MKTWGVAVPIAGHAYIEVKAENEEEAINTALDNVDSSHLQDWEALRQFVRGNTCSCPSPWSAEAEDLGDE